MLPLKTGRLFHVQFYQEDVRMSIITRIINFFSRDKPQNFLSESNYSFVFGGTSSGKIVNARSAMQVSAVNACVRILAETVGSLPLHIYKRTASGKEKVVTHPLYQLLHYEPNPDMTSIVFRETMMNHILLWGNAYSQIVRDGRGRVTALYPLMPDRWCSFL
jgi:phage portal protein BeeE